MTARWTTPTAAATTSYESRILFEAAVAGETTEDFESFGTQIPFSYTTIDVGDFSIYMTGTPSPSTNYNIIDIAPPDAASSSSKPAIFPFLSGLPLESFIIELFKLFISLLLKY